MGWMAEPDIGLSGDQMTPILVVCPGIAIKPTLSLIFQAKTLVVFNMTVEINRNVPRSHGKFRGNVLDFLLRGLLTLVLQGPLFLQENCVLHLADTSKIKVSIKDHTLKEAFAVWASHHCHF